MDIVKKVLRKALLKARGWLVDNSPDGPHDSVAGSYTLNRIYVEVLKDEGCYHLMLGAWCKELTWPRL
jgi:hypothetical protein